MSEKIAVHCETEEEWDKVVVKTGNNDYINDYGREGGIDCLLTTGGRSTYRSYAKGDYTIISAADYLKDEGFKVGDRVRVNANAKIAVGEEGDVVKCWEKTLEVLMDDGNRRTLFNEKWDKLTTNQTKTTKEETMNISDNFAEVFESSTKQAKKMAARFGDQYGNTDRDLIALRNDKTQLEAILKAEEKAEKEAAKK